MIEKSVTFPFEFAVMEAIDQLKLKVVVNRQNAQIDTHSRDCFLLTIQQVMLNRQVAVSVDDSEDESC